MTQFLLSVLVVESVFLWDAWVLAGSDSALFMSHDEWGAHQTPDPGAASTVRSALEAFGVEAAQPAHADGERRCGIIGAFGARRLKRWTLAAKQEAAIAMISTS